MFLSGKYVTVALAVALIGAATPPVSSSPASAPAAAAVEVAIPASKPSRTPPQPATPIQALAVEPKEEPAPRRSTSTGVDGELECLAKIVLHEAGNQSRTGQIAVAEVVMNRVKDRRFPKSICAVALQRGQFFNVHAYRPHRDKRWPLAVEIARQVRDGETKSVTNGALFFRAHYGAPFQGRSRVATIGDHAFYR